MRRLLFCLALVMGSPLGASGQTGDSLLPASRPGDRITVTTAAGDQVRGRLIRDSAGTLVLDANGGEKTIAHAEISRVTERHNRFLFGPLIGLGVGLAVGIPAKARFDNEAADDTAVLAWSVGLGVAIGSFIDLVNGSDRTVYARRAGPASGLHVQASRRGAAMGWSVAW